MPSLILYNQTFLLLHMALRERVARVQNCEERCNITVNSSDNKRRSAWQCVGGGGSGSHMRSALTWAKWQARAHTHTHTEHSTLHINKLPCSFQQRAMVFCKTFSSSCLCAWGIPLNRAEACLKTDPCFHSVLGEKGEGRTVREHGQTKLEQDTDRLHVGLREETERLIIWELSTAVSSTKGGMVNFIAWQGKLKHRKEAFPERGPWAQDT